MFSHTIHNPNNCVISKDYDIIPFGHRCTSALAAKFANIRKYSLPFDWTSPLFPKKIMNVLENNFADFIPDVRKGIFMNKYGIMLVHFDPNINNGIEQYKRRIERCKLIMNTRKKKYFIYINEDYLYEPAFRRNDINNNIFNEMLELEKYLRNKYPNIDYNILYFNFIKHDIPKDSNIINIVLHTDKLYNDHDSSPYDKFRIYCASILADLFKTTLKIDFDTNIFNN